MTYQFNPPIYRRYLHATGPETGGSSGTLCRWTLADQGFHCAHRKGAQRKHLDTTVVGYINSALSVILNIVLVIVIFGFFGVETTTFAALLAGVGIAIGAAWSGLLANFAAGSFWCCCGRLR